MSVIVHFYSNERASKRSFNLVHICDFILSCVQACKQNEKKIGMCTRFSLGKSLIIRTGLELCRPYGAATSHVEFNVLPLVERSKGHC
jgi:hypothetical protein